MSNRERLMSANVDLMTIIAHTKKMGWDSVGSNSLQRIMYLMKVLYAFNHEDENVFGLYHFNVSVSGVNGKSRKRELVIARQVSMYLAQKYTKMPASRIGKLVGGRDHSTVIHSCSQIEQRMKIEKGFAEEVNSIENSFKLKA